MNFATCMAVGSVFIEVREEHAVILQHICALPFSSLERQCWTMGIPDLSNYLCSHRDEVFQVTTTLEALEM